jgi:diguanylate cyclase (GGDEF)-like protein
MWTKTLNKNSMLLISAISCLIILLLITTVASRSHIDNRVIENVQYFVDKSNQHDFLNIHTLPQDVWNNVQHSASSLGMSTDNHWFKFTLADMPLNRSWLLEIDYSLLDKIDIWFMQDQQILRHDQLGDSLPHDNRPIISENFISQVPATDGTLSVLVKVKTAGAVKVPFNLWLKNDYIAAASQDSIFMGVFFGLMLALALGTFLFFIASGTTNFLIYSGYVIFLSLLLASMHGIGYRYLWPNWPWLQHHSLPVLANLTCCLSVLFCDRLLNVKAYSLWLSRALKLFTGVFLCSAVLSLFTPLQMMISIILVTFSVSTLLVLLVSINFWTKGAEASSLFALVWIILFVSGMITSLDSLAILRLNLPLDFIFMFGAILQSLLLVMLLVSCEYQKSLNDASFSSMVEGAMGQDAQQEKLALQETLNEELEYKVQERTLELQIALRELSDTNRELEEKNTLDALTGIRNRYYFDKKYQAEVRRSRRERTELAIVMIDIDHFKSINDQYGHLVGDQCIIFVAKTIQKAFHRPSDDVCRFGGEEFSVILPNTELSGATALVEGLRKEIAEAVIEFDGGQLQLTVSAGVASAVMRIEHPENIILATADQQLYKAKDSGRNNIKSITLS